LARSIPDDQAGPGVAQRRPGGRLWGQPLSSLSAGPAAPTTLTATGPRRRESRSNELAAAPARFPCDPAATSVRKPGAVTSQYTNAEGRRPTCGVGMQYPTTTSLLGIHLHEHGLFRLRCLICCSAER